MSDPNCTCGVGNPFYAHLHSPTCPCAAAWNAAPPSTEERLRTALRDLVAAIEDECVDDIEPALLKAKTVLQPAGYATPNGENNG